MYRMKRMRLLRLPASNSVLPACCGREAGSGSGSSSTDASHADVPRPLCLPVRPAHAGTAASVAAAALIQCLAQRSAQAAEEAAAAAAEIPAAPTDVIISVSFTVAILALTIVTVGVRMPRPLNAACKSWHRALSLRFAEVCARVLRCCTCPSAPSLTKG